MCVVLPGNQPGAIYLTDLPPFLRDFRPNGNHEPIKAEESGLHMSAPDLDEYEAKSQNYRDGEAPYMFLRPLSWLEGCKTTVLITTTRATAFEYEYVRDISFDKVKSNPGTRISILYDDRDFSCVPWREFEAMKRMDELCRREP